MDYAAPSRIYRDAQLRDHRRQDYRGAPTLRRSMAGPLRRRLGQVTGGAIHAWAVGIFGFPQNHRIQRCAVHAARKGIPIPCRTGCEPNSSASWGFECSDHLPRTSIPRATRDATRWFPCRNRECDRFGVGQGCSGAASSADRNSLSKSIAGRFGKTMCLRRARLKTTRLHCHFRSGRLSAARTLSSPTRACSITGVRARVASISPLRR